MYKLVTIGIPFSIELQVLTWFSYFLIDKMCMSQGYHSVTGT